VIRDPGFESGLAQGILIVSIFNMLCIGYIREFNTHNFLSDLTAQWARAYVPSSLVGNGCEFAPRPALAHLEKYFFPIIL
jgi:hypothetical protein